MKIKLPKLNSPKLNFPKPKAPKLFNGGDKSSANTKNIINEAKNKVPEPIKNFIPNLDTGNGGKQFDVNTMIKKSSFDIDGMLSKNMDVNSLMKNLGSDISFNFGSSSYIPSDVMNQTFDLS